MSQSIENGPNKSGHEQGYANPPDLTPRREGGDDAIAEKITADSKSDEKVIDNREEKETSTGTTPADKLL